MNEHCPKCGSNEFETVTKTWDEFTVLDGEIVLGKRIDEEMIIKCADCDLELSETQFLKEHKERHENQ
jgi:predicted  nucleic acid-binding Zn-ribbon protein